MANVKISALPAATTVASNDLLPIVQGGATKQTTPDLLPLSAAAVAALAGKASLASPAFTGAPTIGGTAVAKTSDITAAVNQLLGGASTAYDTLGELATQLASDENAAAALTTLVGQKSLSLPVNVITPAGASVRNAVIGARNSVDASTGPVTVALPTPTVVGQMLILERADASAVAANAITVTGTIRNAPSTVVLNAVGAAFEGALYIAESLTSWAIAGSIKPRAVLDAAYEAKGAVATQAAADAAIYAPKVRTAQAQRWTTSADVTTQQLAASTPPPFASIVARSPLDVVVDPGQRYQEVWGLGAALTDSAAYCLLNYRTAPQRQALLQQLYGPTQNGWNTVRIGLGATDFESVPAFSYDDVTSGTDPTLAAFSIAKDTVRVIPVLKEILAINPAVRIFASVWTPPNWMLTSGVIDPTNYTVFGNYIVATLQAFAAHGINIFSVAPVNEPVGRYTTTQQQQLIQAVGAAIVAAGLQTRVMGNDDQWSNGGGSVPAILGDTTTRGYLRDVGWHGYGGSAKYMSDLRNLYPYIDHHATEFRTLQVETLTASMAEMAGGYVVGSLRNQARTVTLWNLALDEVGRPGGNTGRRGAVAINSDGSGVTYNPEYFAVTHATRFLQRGAVICHSTSFGKSYWPGTNPIVALTTVAWVNPDGSVALYAYNGTSSAQTFQVIDARSGQGFPCTMQAGELSTFLWGTSNQSLPAGAPSGLTAPGKPTAAATGGAGQVQVSWTAPVSSAPVIAYTIARSTTPGGAKTTVAQVAAGGTLFTDSVAAGTWYYTVAASSIAGVTTSDEVTATATAAASTVTATDNGNGTFTISGTSVTDNGNGTATITDAAVTDNGNGTATITA